MPLVKIPGTTFVRDTNTMALINTDSVGLEEYTFEFLGVRNPTNEEINNSEKIEKYFEYIFSNKLFTDIVDII